MPAVQDAVAVKGVGVGVGSPKEKNQVHYDSRKGGEVGACKDLEGNVFTIGSGNKGKRWRHAMYLQGEVGTVYWHQLRR